MKSKKLQCSRCGIWEDSELMNTEDYLGNPTCMCNDCFENEEEFNQQWEVVMSNLKKVVDEYKSQQLAR